METIYLLFIVLLAAFLGFELITKVPPTLHTPLMSGANAISGISIIGALIGSCIIGGLLEWCIIIGLILRWCIIGGFLGSCIIGGALIG